MNPSEIQPARRRPSRLAPGALLLVLSAFAATACMELEGAYVYGDFVTGVILSFGYDAETGEKTDPVQIASVPRITSFGLDNNGEILVVSRNGPIYRLESRE